VIQLYLGDCLEVMKQIPSKSVDLVLTDPPYGTTACSWDSVIPFEPMWEQLKRVSSEKSPIVLFGSEPFSSHLRFSNLKNFKYDWIWDKKKAGNIFNLESQPAKVHEIISVFSYDKHNYYPIKIPQPFRRSKSYGIGETMGGGNYGDMREYDDKYPTSIQSFSNADQTGKVHPTQKPVDLLEYLIKTYTKENETVLDFTMGSGSTGVACKHLNRSFIGIEKDETYFSIAKKRIENAQMCIQTDLFEAGL
jgi:DNA modification methylase